MADWILVNKSFLLGIAYLIHFKTLFDVQTPQTIKWDDIEPSTEWNLLSASPAEPAENKNIEDIIQTKEGHVFVKFDKGKRLAARSSFSDYESSFKQSQSARFYTPNPSCLVYLFIFEINNFLV